MAIRWETGRYGNEAGYVGNLRLFTISHSLTRRTDGRSAVLATTLPMKMPAGMENWDDYAEAKRAAEGVLDMFLGHVERHRGERP